MYIYVHVTHKYRKIDFAKRTALVFGNEKNGISPHMSQVHMFTSQRLYVHTCRIFTKLILPRELRWCLAMKKTVFLRIFPRCTCTGLKGYV